MLARRLGLIGALAAAVCGALCGCGGATPTSDPTDQIFSVWSGTPTATDDPNNPVVLPDDTKLDDEPTATAVGALYVSSDTLTFDGLTDERSLYIRNTGSGELTYDVMTTTPWLVLTGTHGTSQGEFGRTAVRVQRDGLGVGSYAGEIAIVAGESQVTVDVLLMVAEAPADGTPSLDVPFDELTFAASQSERSFYVRNAGAGTLGVTLLSGVDWVSVQPTRVSATADWTQVQVFVHAAQKPEGLQGAWVRVAGDNGQTHDVLVWAGADMFGVAADAALSTSTAALDFGASSGLRAMTVQNTGDTPLSFAVDVNVDWLRVYPQAGQLDDQAVELRAVINRHGVIVGDHPATLTIRTDAGERKTVQVAMNKPLTASKIIPWREVGSKYQDYVNPGLYADTVDGLRKYQYVTDTAIITTTYMQIFLYGELARDVPGMTIIPGLKTSARLGNDEEADFDNLAGWQLIAQDVQDVIDATGCTTFVFENEGASRSFYSGEATIDLEQFRTCMSYLPDNVEYIWYPPPAYDHPSWDMCAVVQEELDDVRFMNFAYSFPEWEKYYRPDRDAPELLGERPSVAMAYFGCSGVRCYWPFDAAPEILQVVAGRSEVIFYPLNYDWVPVAQQTADLLWPDVWPEP